MEGWIFWAIFGVVVLAGMALDLGVFHREAKAVSVREALLFTSLWITLALAFNVAIYFFIDPQYADSSTRPSVEFLTCYITEYALSVDNIFVFLVIFQYFAIPPESQHRVLLWGVLGAMLMRGVFLYIGIEAIERFHWVLYVLGALLVFTGIKLMFQRDDDGLDPDKNFVLRFARRFLRVTNTFVGSQFFTRIDGKRFVTPLFLALLVVETTDVLFAVDSVPASLGISQNLFVVYTSNIFAILGLRSLFFAVGGLLRFLHYLKYGLAVVLVFIGVKMVLPVEYKIPVEWALGTVAGILLIAVLASLIRARILKNRQGNEEAT
ncbi:MAG: TerC family protein [Planctomycetes bacterium]|nr:TerC family protein [Planctomycetota bacterium]